eukprot:2846514-Pyramimonas_sp.AAC.1
MRPARSSRRTQSQRAASEPPRRGSQCGTAGSWICASSASGSAMSESGPPWHGRHLSPARSSASTGAPDR